MQLIGLPQIMSRAFHGDDLVSLTSELSARIERDASDAAAMLDLATVWQIRGQSELANNFSGRLCNCVNTIRSSAIHSDQH